MPGFAEDRQPWAVDALSSDPVVLVDLDELSEGESPRVAGIDEAHVEVLAAVLDRLPPILVHQETLRVIDGAHRVLAARALGRTRLPARLVDADAADAFVAAVRANTSHGLPLSLPDRKAAAATILRTHPHWSDRMIADVVGLSAKTVAATRTGDGSALTGRLGRDGKVRPLDGARRRRVAARLLGENPDLSLRQVARMAGISPETARSVKVRLARGAEPADADRKAPVRAAPAQPDLATVVRRLRADPSLRFTETGRALLRLMEAHVVSSGRWESVAAGVPPHCRSTVAAVADEFARAWHSFAEQLARIPE
jgi:ParB-like chromosome segregation protein Spo0J